MNYVFLALAATLAALAGPAIARAELPVLTVRVSNLPSASGTVEVSLFDSAESFLQQPYLQKSGKVDENFDFEATFVALPAGEYAVVVVHDANDNKQLDTGYLGFGAEAYGYSNNVQPWFGRPAFDDVKFMLDQEPVDVEIDLD